MSRWKGIRTLNYGEKSEGQFVVALGFFDCLHIGHIKLIEECKLLAFKNNCRNAVFTFSNSPFEVLGKDKGQILNFEERLFKLDRVRVDVCIAAKFDKAFSELSPIAFLNKLIENLSIKGIVVGSDYTLGKCGSGNVDLLKNWCDDSNIELKVVDFALDEGKKISSSTVRKLLIDGDIKKANEYLYYPYFVTGNILRGHMRGRKIGFATANLEYPKDKLRIRAGVYYTRVLVDGVWLKAVTNVGKQPTFDGDEFNIESYILYYSGDIYGKKVTVEFIERIRDIKKFSSKEELAERIAKDVEFALSSKL